MLALGELTAIFVLSIGEIRDRLVEPTQLEAAMKANIAIGSEAEYTIRLVLMESKNNWTLTGYNTGSGCIFSVDASLETRITCLTPIGLTECFGECNNNARFSSSSPHHIDHTIVLIHKSNVDIHFHSLVRCD
ncbi:unnamed protein product [Dicrocoelium dendriticum]|nr:unnamed protein product [Dicrocoelium dendriticum]